MFYKKKKQKGFTLIELLIAMAIFIGFTGVLINSYTGIVRSLNEANHFRIVYSEARTIFDKFVDETRNNSIYYASNTISSFNGAVSELTLISENGERVVKFKKIDDKVEFTESENCRLKEKKYFLNSDELKIEELNFFVTPSFDPYSDENVIYNSLQFQPKVTLYAKFSRNGREMDLQTTVSSRFYSSAPDIDISCIPFDE